MMKNGFLVSALLGMFVIGCMESCTKPGYDTSTQKSAPFDLLASSNLLSGSSQTLLVTTPFSNDTVNVTDVVTDAAGNKYISDNRALCIRKITPSGLVSILAGGAPPVASGPNGPSIDGPGNQARFGAPLGLAIDAAGNIYVADAGLNRVRKITPDGFVSTIGGSGPTFGSGSAGFQDGSLPNSKFNQPFDVAVDASGNVYVADGGNNRIRIISGFSISTFAGDGTQGALDGPASSASFQFPTGVAVDPSGNIIVSDFGNNRIRKITQSRVVSTLAGSVKGSSDGAGAAAQFNAPNHLTTDVAGNVFVADESNFRIRKITPAGIVSTFAGRGIPGFLDGSAANALFADPSGVAVDALGHVFVTDAHKVREISLSAAAGVYTIAGNGTAGLTDGTGAAALFNSPTGLVINAAGNILVADATNQKIRLMTPDGNVSTLAGSIGGFRDGTLTTARFNAPTSLAVDPAGNIYVADQINQRIRKITPAGAVSTIAGDGTRGYVEGPGAGAEFRYPTSVAADASGNVYVADVENFCIRKISPAGVVSTLAGSGAAGFADNTGAAAKFAFPQGIAMDASGNIIVADKNNHRIRKVSPAGVVTTIAGTGKPGYADGGGTTAQFSSPIAVSVDAAGNILVTDQGNQRIRKISPAGIVSTLAGNGLAGFSDGSYSQAQFNNPVGTTVDASGAVYVADKENNRIRKIQ
jgi:sugar lactone lactonase YvrE